MKIETKSGNFNTLDGWTMKKDFLAEVAARDVIGSASEMRPCGCGVKLDLRDVVYPALHENGDTYGYGLGRRVDAAVRKGAFAGWKRFVMPLEDLLKGRDEFERVAKEMAEFGCDSVVELFSTSRNYFGDPKGTRREFARAVRAKTRLLKRVEGYLGGKRLSFGKGHSIRAGGDRILFDAVRVDSNAEGYTLLNNDTIITADSLLRHYSVISVFTALNNALNDLFLHGVTEELILHPVYDGTPEEVRRIKEALEAYARFYEERGVKVKIDDSGPLNAGMKVIGATVSGRAYHEPPQLSGLRKGQKLLVTRFLGDLSFLSLNRSQYFTPERSEELNSVRIEVLQRMSTPNYLAAKTLQKYLPRLGEKFDPARHVTFASDVSGPGLSVLGEAAEASGHDVVIEDLRFIDERSLRHYRKDHTTSTNGPLIFAAEENVLASLEQDLRSIGYVECWRLGHVGAKSEEPHLRVRRALHEKYHSQDPRLDFFRPEVRFDNGEAIRVPIFPKYVFDDVA